MCAFCIGHAALWRCSVMLVCKFFLRRCLGWFLGAEMTLYGLPVVLGITEGQSLKEQCRVAINIV